MIVFKKRTNGTFDKFLNEEFCGNFIGNDPSNSLCVELDEWLELGNVLAWSDLENLEESKKDKISQCQTYLGSTDWQVIRLSDPTSGEASKEGIAEKRVLARSLQIDIEACTTIEELSNINTNF
jgi:hypothetical protein